ncbi:hypothetical protein BWI17_02220 [Betaproteobacteria bacterium GR16-43]|nr:hypothetical protein BWI17_02220 [Betaproteobacteria bacterium GR16-43]
MKTLPKVAALAVCAAFAIPAYAQMNIPGVTKTKEVEKLSKSDIAKEMLLKNKDIDACKDEAKKKEPKVTGNLAVRFKVNTDGTTTDISIVDVKLQNSAFGSCVQGKVKGWTFSKAKQKSDNYDLVAAF